MIVVDASLKKRWADNIHHFSPDEFDDPTEKGSGYLMVFDVVKFLDNMRESLKTPLFVVSGYRTKEHNKKVGGSPQSAHLRGLAVDLLCTDSNLRYRLVALLFSRGVERIEVAQDHVHFDFDQSLPLNVLFLPLEIGK